MEMPENCAVCPFVTEYSRCVFLGMYAIDEERRADNCPIICSLPEGHGDLISRSAIAITCPGQIKIEDGEYWIRFGAVRESIKSAPTIVPAERRET
jgi:hypothetical protein